jgi:hypothetical protein
MQTINIQDKNTTLSLKQRVKKILYLKGYSYLFNSTDFKYYVPIYKNEFNPALEIAKKFIEDNPYQVSDFNNYIY